MRGWPSDRALQRLGTHLASEPKVVLAYLHGSVVHSRPGRDPSDIDLAVLLDDLADRATRETFAIDLAIRLERETGLGPLDLRPLNDAPLEFQFRVFARGRRLFVRDEIRRIRYEAETTSLYQDFRPALDEYNRTMMRHILQEADRGGP